MQSVRMRYHRAEENVHLCAVFQRVHHVCHHSAGGRQLACALAVEHHIAQHIALDQHRVEHIVHAGQLVCLGHQTRLYTGGHAAVLAKLHPCDQLDNAAQLFGAGHIGGGNGADAPGGDVLSSAYATRFSGRFFGKTVTP